MYKVYFKQAIQMLKQNKFMSIIAILGTALAIMMIMTIIVAEEVKTANVAPEENKYRTYFINGHIERDTVTNNSSSRFGVVHYKIIHDYLKDLKTPELISIYSTDGQRVNVAVSTTGKKESFGMNVRATDAAYWKLHSHQFVKGRPYTQEEVDSGIPYIVICESEARNLFKGEEALGRTLEIANVEYKVIGIVKDVSPLFKHAYSKIWATFTSVKKYDEGSYMVALLAKSPSDYPAIYQEIRDAEKKYATDLAPKTIYILGPYDYSSLLAGVRGYSKEESNEAIQVLNRKRILILVILLLIPALNLSGISLSRIKKRTPEIGVRKAFGARKYVILIQVLYENFITSLIGGVLGLLFSYVAIFRMKKWLLSVAEDSAIPLETLASPAIFGSVFLVCMVINLLSAGLPAYRASRISIVHSLNQNEK